MKIRGDRIEELRGRLGWSQDRLADEAGVARDTISKLESGARKRAHASTVAKVTRALGVGLTALADGPPGALDDEQPGDDSWPPVSEGGEPRLPLAELGEEAAKRALLRDVSEALEGPELAVLLQVAGHMLAGKLATMAAERGAEEGRVTPFDRPSSASPTGEDRRDTEPDSRHTAPRSEGYARELDA